MLIISKQQVENLIRRLDDPTKLEQCQREVEKMLEIKSASLWRAGELRPCCGSFEQIKVCLDSEVQILQDVRDALDKGDIPQASSLLRDYTHYLEPGSNSGGN
ncbi:MAG: hypothetical protein OEZ00_06645 [Dehalococcoidia bacterium]|nr:hypothetical protein [Dehalococcoidia bacterium]